MDTEKIKEDTEVEAIVKACMNILDNLSNKGV